MELTTYSIVNVITNFFTIFVIQRFMKSFFQKHNCSKALSIFTYLLYFIATSTVYFLFSIPVVNLLTSWLTIFLISCTYESTPQKRLIYVTYIMMFMLISEILVAAITGYVNFSAFTTSDYRDSTGLVTTWLVKYFFALLFRNIKSTRTNQNINWASWASSILIPIITLAQELILVSCSDLTQTKAIISVVLVLAINVMFFYLYDMLADSYVRRSQFYLMEKENELYSKQCEIMQSATQDLQAFRHDTNNQLIALSELLSAGRYDDAKEQLCELAHLTKGRIIYSTSGNVIIDGMINYKLQNAGKENIQVKTEIAVPMQININTTDLIAVLGNLLDNALAANQKLDADHRSLLLKIVYSQQRLLIRTSNPYNESIRIENGKILTSKKDAQNHGFGLSNIAKAVDKYNGYMEVETGNNTFTVDIIMYVPQ